MQFTITINQRAAMAYGLNIQQAAVLSYLQKAWKWAEPVEQGGKTFYAISKRMVIEALPMLTDKEDTAYRLMKALEKQGLVELSHTEFSTLVRLTEKGAK